MAADQSEKTMDVRKPGTTAATSTSRPVIVGHKATIQDDMVKSSAETTTGEKSKETAIPVSVHKVVKPLSAADKEPDEADKTNNSDKSNTADQPVEQPAKQEGESDGANLADNSSDAAAVDTIAEQAGSRKEEKKLAEEAQKKQQALNKLVSERKYFVPISTSRKKKGVLWSVVLLAVILLAAGLYLAAAAGIIDLGFEPTFQL